MNKRDFLKISSMALGSTALPTALRADTAAPRTNWAGNITYSTDRLLTPANVGDLAATLRGSASARILGSRHAFNRIADSTVEQISLHGFQEMRIDAEARTVTVGGGVRYGDVAPMLDAHGFALANLASLPHITVAGAISTATHGSGVHNPNLSMAVNSLTFLNHEGQPVTLSRTHDGDTFRGAVVSLGCLGPITSLTLDLLPTFQMRQVVYLHLPFHALEEHFDEILGAGYSVSLFTDWQGGEASEVWIKSKVDPGKAFHLEPEFFGATAATRKVHPILDHNPEAATDQLGIPGPWYERMPHFLLRFTPSSGQELQTEYFVPREHGMAAIRAVEQLRDRITPHLLISEIRTIAADDLWLSPCHGQDSMTIHFTWKPEWPEVREVLPAIEAALAPFHPRPHWAKLFTMSPELVQAAYPRMAEFRKLAELQDPKGRLRNRFVNDLIFT